MNTKIEALVGYLAGDVGAAAEQARAELGEPQSEASLFLEEARRLSREALGAEVLRRVSLFATLAPAAGEEADAPAPPPGPSAEAAAPPTPVAGGRRWPRAVPWAISLASCVLVALLYHEVREQRHRLDVTLTILDGHLHQASPGPGAGAARSLAPAGKPGPGEGPAKPKAPPPRPARPPGPGGGVPVDVEPLAEALAPRLARPQTPPLDVSQQLSEALGGVASRRDLARVEKQLARTEEAVAALSRAVSARPAPAAPSSPPHSK
jgi:hypothetical protein